MRSKPWRYTSLVAGAAIGMGGGFAALYFSTLSIFLKPIAASFGWGRGQLSAVALLAMLGSALAAPLIGKMIDRYGAQRITGASVLLLAAGLCSMAVVPADFLVLGILTLLLGGFATATTAPGYLSVFPQHFDRRLGSAMGCAMIGLGAGSALAPLLAQSLIAAYGWRHAYLVLAGISLALGLLANLLCFVAGPRQPSAMPAVRHGTITNNSGTPFAMPLDGEDLRVAVRSGRFWLIAVAVALVSASALGAMIHFAAMLSDRGIAPAEAAAGAAAVGLAAGLGRFVSGLLMDRMSARMVTAGVFGMGAIGLATLAFSSSTTPMSVYTAAAVLFGLAIGAEGDIIPFLARRYFGLKAFGALFGCLFSAYMLGAFVGPIAYGAAFERWGSYTVPLLTGSGACILAAIMVIAIGPYRYAIQQHHGSA